MSNLAFEALEAGRITTSLGVLYDGQICGNATLSFHPWYEWQGEVELTPLTRYPTDPEARAEILKNLAYYLFSENPKLQSIDLFVDSENLPEQSALERLGFIRGEAVRTARSEQGYRRYQSFRYER